MATTEDRFAAVDARLDAVQQRHLDFVMLIDEQLAAVDAKLVAINRQNLALAEGVEVLGRYV